MHIKCSVPNLIGEPLVARLLVRREIATFQREAQAEGTGFGGQREYVISAFPLPYCDAL